MAKPSVLISIDTFIKTEDKNFGLNFMRRLLDEDSLLAPELVSTSERFLEPFIDLDHFVNEWWAIPIKSYVDDQFVGERFGGPHWKRKSALAGRGMVNHGLINAKHLRTPSTLWFQSRWDKRVSFTHLFEEWVELAEPNIGMLHLFTDAESGLLQGGAGSSFAVGSFGGPAKPGIPNIGWAMAYGEGYAEEVDVARIKAAGFPVDEFGGVVIVRVTESLSDLQDNFSYFSRRRNELKAMFRPDLFWIKGESVVGA